MGIEISHRGIMNISMEDCPFLSTIVQVGLRSKQKSQAGQSSRGRISVEKEIPRF